MESFTALAESQGIWAAVALVLATALYRIEEARIKEKNGRIAELEAGAEKALAAKDLERLEWKRISDLANEELRQQARTLAGIVASRQKGDGS